MIGSRVTEFGVLQRHHPRWWWRSKGSECDRFNIGNDVEDWPPTEGPDARREPTSNARTYTIG